jgi:mono/diheme cytochrome c family protein
MKSLLSVFSGLLIFHLAAHCLLAQAPANPSAAPAQNPPVRGTEMAGATQFRAHCETCHGKTPTAPSLAMLRKMAPERIYQALTTGPMRNEAQEAKLTDLELRDIAAWMGGRKLQGDKDDAAKMPNRCSNNPP